MRKKRRLSAETEQEELSRAQFGERLIKYGGWLSDPLRPDLGEDLLVRIYDKGISSGLVFFVQLKSTTNLKKLGINNDQISYPIEVADLKHWEVSATPIFLVVWDVNEKIGLWAKLDDIFAELGRRNPNWENKVKVRVHIPSSNRIDDDGLRRIRRLVADYVYPVVSRGKEHTVNFRFVFPNTANGKEALQAFERFYKYGDPLQIDSEYIKAFSFPQWYTTLYGTSNEENVPGYLKFVPTPDPQPIPAGIELYTETGGRVSIPYIDFRRVKEGTEQIVLSNEHQHYPLLFTLYISSVPSYSMSLNVKLTDPNSNVQDSRDALAFLGVLGSTSKTRFTLYSLGRSSDFLPLTDIESSISQEQIAPLLEILDKLCFIQQKTGHVLALKEWWVSDDDLKVIDEVYTICTTGRVPLRNMQCTLSLRKPGLNVFRNTFEGGSNRAQLVVVRDSSEIELLGVMIPLGKSKWEMDVIPTRPIEEIVQMFQDIGDDDSLNITFDVNTGTVEYTEWL